MLHSREPLLKALVKLFQKHLCKYRAFGAPPATANIAFSLNLVLTSRKKCVILLVDQKNAMTKKSKLLRSCRERAVGASPWQELQKSLWSGVGEEKHRCFLCSRQRIPPLSVRGVHKHVFLACVQNQVVPRASTS